MPVKVTIDIEGQELLKKALKRADETTRERVSEAVTATAIDVQAAAKDNLTKSGAVDTGRLRSSIRIRFHPQGLTYAADVYTDVAYAEPVEFGAHFTGRQPPAEALLGWMRRHGIPAKYAFIIARNIKRRGLKARPFLFPAWESNKLKLHKRLRDIIGGLER